MQDKGKLLEELRLTIERVHRCRAEYRRTVSVNERAGGKTVWQGDVEIFWLTDHPKARRCFAWAIGGECESLGCRVETVLDIPPVIGPVTAVRSALKRQKE